MKRLPSEPTRLLDLRSQDDPANVAHLVRSALRAPAEPVPRLKGRIRYTLRRQSVRRRRYLRFALVGGVLFLTGGVVGAVVQPVLRLWQQHKVESVETIHPSPSAARARHRRASTPLPRIADESLLAPDQPAEPPSLPPAPSPTEPAAARAEPPPQAELPPARMRPTRALAPVIPVSLTAPAPAGPAARPALARRPADRAPLQTAMLEPPPRLPERWPASPPAAPPMLTVAPSAHGSAAPLAPPPVPSPPAAETAFPPTTADTISPRPVSAAPASTAVAPKPTAPPPPSEQALLSRAVRSLRSEHRPASALAVLDEYVARFPSGSLLPEATRLRTEALLALGQKPEALAELNRETEAGAAGGEESRLVRGELHASAGRWQIALEEFDAVVRARLAHEPTLGPATSAKLRERFERALWGRASARSHLGDDAGARADLHECLRRFPKGRFAAQAARLLGELR